MDRREARGPRREAGESGLGKAGWRTGMVRQPAVEVACPRFLVGRVANAVITTVITQNFNRGWAGMNIAIKPQGHKCTERAGKPGYGDLPTNGTKARINRRLPARQPVFFMFPGRGLG